MQQFKPQLANPAVFYAQGSLSAVVMADFQRDLDQWIGENSASFLVIDFRAVDFLDSSTLVVLVNTYKQARLRGKQLFLSGISPELRIIFELTQLDTVFPLYQTPEEAFASVRELSAAA